MSEFATLLICFTLGMIVMNISIYLMAWVYIELTEPYRHTKFRNWARQRHQRVERIGRF